MDASQTAASSTIRTGSALSIARKYTTPGVHPFETVDWELRDARIGHGDRVSFEQTNVEFPKTWSQNATNIVSQKYFRGQLDSPTRERSVKQMIGRVAGTIADWGRQRGYFDSAEMEENMSTHYGRMIHEDDRTIMFANPEDAAEYIGFDLRAAG